MTCDPLSLWIISAKKCFNLKHQPYNNQSFGKGRNSLNHNTGILLVVMMFISRCLLTHPGVKLAFIMTINPFLENIINIFHSEVANCCAAIHRVVTRSSICFGADVL